MASQEAFEAAWNIVTAAIAAERIPTNRLGRILAFLNDANPDGLLERTSLDLVVDEDALVDIWKTHAGFILGHKVARL